jgi:H+/Cl- antiporter ClcA
MWKRFKDLKYLTIIKYYFLGIVFAVIVYQFVTKSMINHELSFNSLIEKETLKHIIATLIGGFFGGFVFILMANKTDRLIKEKILWENIKEKKTLFFIRNLFAFSIAGLAYKLIGNLFDLDSYDNLIQILFSRNFIIEYIGMILAMIVFSILISIGIKKRLNLLYGK